ncbi:putative ESCRT-II subunit protein [Clavispora lusitaniae]|uniref:Vacuolar protein-sorting-associated protein 36 n=1 Tax=Clavispora lusitaniae TaxID=36911 RepID=A0AA91T1R6_CLALS|nr:putative ESCRT-II subunit protein [Clavispora lusitaniae]
MSKESFLHVWQPVAINKSSRPVLSEDEHTLYVKEGVGLYQGRAKIVNHQDGRVYLTNKRIVYVDGRQAVAVSLRDTARAEHVERFLRASPKVKVYLARGGTRAAPEQWRWTCRICSFRNTVPSKEGAQCVACGIRPAPNELTTQTNTTTTTTTNKSTNTNTISTNATNTNANANANSNASTNTNTSANTNTKPSTTFVSDNSDASVSSLSRNNSSATLETSAAKTPTAANGLACPACTFLNHPSMRACELCSTPLQAAAPDPPRSDANPARLALDGPEEYTGGAPYVKFSFRAGGDTDFHTHLVAAIDAEKWAALERANKVGKGDVPPQEPARRTGGGILHLEQQSENRRRENEQVLASSLDDLQQLMAQAQDLIALATSFRPVVRKNAARDLARDMRSLAAACGAVRAGSALFHAELARHMCEFLLARDLSSAAAMITMPDLFARYNRFRVSAQGLAAGLVSTEDIRTSLELANSLALPVQIKKYSSGLEVVARRTLESEGVAARIVAFLKDVQDGKSAETDFEGDTDRQWRGASVAEVAAHFGWAYAVCVEELDRCIDQQLVVYDRHVSGTFYYANAFGTWAQEARCKV